MDFDRLLLLDVGGTFIKTSDGREIPVNSNGDKQSVFLSFHKAVKDFCNEGELYGLPLLSQEESLALIDRYTNYYNKSAQFKFSVASPRGANQKMVQHDTG